MKINKIFYYSVLCFLCFSCLTLKNFPHDDSFHEGDVVVVIKTNYHIKFYTKNSNKKNDFTIKNYRLHKNEDATTFYYKTNYNRYKVKEYSIANENLEHLLTKRFYEFYNDRELNSHAPFSVIFFMIDREGKIVYKGVQKPDISGINNKYTRDFLENINTDLFKSNEKFKLEENELFMLVFNVDFSSKRCYLQ